MCGGGGGGGALLRRRAQARAVLLRLGVCLCVPCARLRALLVAVPVHSARTRSTRPLGTHTTLRLRLAAAACSALTWPNRQRQAAERADRERQERQEVDEAERRRKLGPADVGFRCGGAVGPDAAARWLAGCISSASRAAQPV